METVIVAVNPSQTAIVLPESTTLTMVISMEYPLTTLDESGCTALNALDCTGNRLVKLDITVCPNLVDLMCGDQSSDGTTPQTPTLTMTVDQKLKWDNEWSTYAADVNVDVK